MQKATNLAKTKCEVSIQSYA